MLQPPPPILSVSWPIPSFFHDNRLFKRMKGCGVGSLCYGSIRYAIPFCPRREICLGLCTKMPQSLQQNKLHINKTTPAVWNHSDEEYHIIHFASTKILHVYIAHS